MVHIWRPTLVLIIKLWLFLFRLLYIWYISLFRVCCEFALLILFNIIFRANSIILLVCTSFFFALECPFIANGGLDGLIFLFMIHVIVIFNVASPIRLLFLFIVFFLFITLMHVIIFLIVVLLFIHDLQILLHQKLGIEIVTTFDQLSDLQRRDVAEETHHDIVRLVHVEHDCNKYDKRCYQGKYA